MERARHRKSKSASGIEGVPQIQKTAPRMSIDSRICINGSKRDDMFLLEVGQSSWRGPTGKPIKKFPVEEISREVELRRRRPSVIARLMGLECLPSPRPVDRQQKRLTDTHQPTEFKDVYEDLEANRRFQRSSNRRAGSVVTNPELALTQPKLWASGEMDHMLKQLWHPDSPGNRIAVLKPYEKKAILKREDGLLLKHHSCHRAHVSRSPSRAQSQVEIEEKSLPTRIVILKPNMRKAQIMPSPSCDRMNRPVSKEAREIAREITMRMRDGYDETSDTKSIWGRGYAGDESSYEGSESDSESESEGFVSSYKLPFRYPSLGRVKSSVNREAKRRLSERWKMTHDYRDKGVAISNDSTLGEMLDVPNRGTRPERSYAKMSPSGVRSKSLPPSRKGSSHHPDVLTVDKVVMMHSETVNHSASKVVKRNKVEKQDDLCSYSKSMVKKNSHPCRDMYIIEMGSSTEDISEQHSAFEIPAKAKACRGPVVDVTMIPETVSTTLLPEGSKLAQKRPSLVTGGDESTIQERGDCGLQVPTKRASPFSPCPVAEPELSESINEADHRSPNSVFESFFTEDASSAESFERVSAELQELRLQLQLLKMESSTNAADVSTHSPVEEDVQSSIAVSERTDSLRFEDWQTRYALDVLTSSGILHAPDSRSFETSLHSPDCPLDPNLFDSLEKKHSDDHRATMAKWERKLLFDRINSALTRIFSEHMDPRPWVMPNAPGRAEGVGDAVGRLVERLGSSEVEILEKVVDRETGWGWPMGGVNAVGNEIERLLMEDMVAEVLLCM